MTDETGTRLLVCGGRDYFLRRGFVKATIAAINPTLVIQGGAKGADTLARYAANELEITCHQYDADWNKWGKAAGYRRNAEMLKEGKPDLVLAFPGGKGTQMMCKLAEEAGVPVILGDFARWLECDS